MKKGISVILFVCLCCGVLAGCGGKADATKLPHNSKISITDKKSDIIENDNLKTEDEITYTTQEPVKIDGNDYEVAYTFSNAEGEYIASVCYDSTSAGVEEAQKYIDSVYGELDKDTTEGKYGPGQDGRYIIKSDDKVWTIGCFTADNGCTRILISRDATLE